MHALRDLASALRLLLTGLDRATAWRLCASGLLAGAGGGLAGLSPLALKEMIDAVDDLPRTQDHIGSVAWFGTAYLLCLGIGRLLTELRPWLISAAEQRLYAQLRQQFFSHLLALPLSFHLARRTGSLVHALQLAVSAYQVILSHLVNSIVPVFVEAMTVTVVLVTLGQPELTAAFVATALAYFAALSFHTADLSRSAQTVSNASISANSLLTDALINLEPIKCFGAERKTLKAYTRATAVLEGGWALLQRLRLTMALRVTVIFLLSMAASISIAVHAVTQGRLTVGGFVLANLYMLQLMRPLEMLSMAARDVVQGLAFIRPLIDVLAQPAEPSVPPLHLTESDAEVNETEVETEVGARNGLEPIVRAPPRVSFKDVRLVFDSGHPVLNGFCLDVPAGSSAAIVGASGCGKSSLVRLLLRICEPEAGTVLLDDIAIDALPIATLRSMIAVVPQDVVLFNTTIAANIGLGKEGASSREIQRAARLAEVHGFIAALPCGYDTAIGERGLKLSGGERQRIAIARAILRDAQILVFDEATSMLDGPTEKAILQNLRDIARGRTTLTIAHRLSTIQHADQIVVLANGRIEEQGTHATLLAQNGLYATMWRAQQSGSR